MKPVLTLLTIVAFLWVGCSSDGPVSPPATRTSREIKVTASVDSSAWYLFSYIDPAGTAHCDSVPVWPPSNIIPVMEFTYEAAYQCQSPMRFAVRYTDAGKSRIRLTFSAKGGVHDTTIGWIGLNLIDTGEFLLP